MFVIGRCGDAGCTFSGLIMHDLTHLQRKGVFDRLWISRYFNSHHLQEHPYDLDIWTHPMLTVSVCSTLSSSFISFCMASIQCKGDQKSIQITHLECLCNFEGPNSDCYFCRPPFHLYCLQFNKSDHDRSWLSCLGEKPANSIRRYRNRKNTLT